MPSNVGHNGVETITKPADKKCRFRIAAGGEGTKELVVDVR